MLHDGKFRIKLGLPDGDAFPTTPAPERGDIFHRNDLGRIFRYDGGAWVDIIQGADHDLLSGLGDDDHTIYFLADCTRAFAGDPIPDGADTRSLGSATAEWRNIYVGEAGKIYFRLNQGVNLYSSAAGVLKTDDHFHCALEVFAGNGLVGSPAYAFISDVDTGMYRIGVNDLGFTTNSTLALELNASQQALVTVGTVAAPGLAFISDPDTGLYRIGANRLGFATDGTFAIEIDAAQKVGIGITPTEKVHVRGKTQPFERFLLDGIPLGAPGTQVGMQFTLRAHSDDGAPHYRDFVLRAVTTTNAGVGLIQWLTLLDGAGEAAVLSIHSNGDLMPVGAGTANFGDAASYWADISYKTLTDRGCLFAADEGVEMMDGTILSDMEALLAIKIHEDKLSIQGLPALDYSTMPKAVYRPAPIVDGEKQGADGAELTALISIMLGAIKELHSRKEDKIQP